MLSNNFKLNTKHQNLLTDFLDSKVDLKQTSKTHYINSFKKLIYICFGDNKRKLITALKQAKLIEIMMNQNNPLNSKIDLLKMYKYILEFTNKQYRLVDNQLNALYGQTRVSSIQSNKDLLNRTINYEKLMDILDKLSDDEYLLFYLLINYNVRNMDLYIKYTDNPDVIEKANEGKLDYNVLYYNDKKQLVYIRSYYKTLKKYGIKKHIITDEKFNEIMKYKTVNNFIFKSRTGLDRQENTLSKYINSVGNKVYPRSNLNQQNIYKIIANKYIGDNDHKKLQEIANNRGHSLDIQNNVYTTSSIL